MTNLSNSTETNNTFNLQELKKQKEDNTTELIKSVGMFFAFSTEQFHENKTPLQEGEKYVSIGAGAYMPKSQVKNWINGIKEIKKQYKAAVKGNKLRKQEIAYQLNNYECYYTGDISDALEALGSDYTQAEVMAVYKENHAKWCAVN